MSKVYMSKLNFYLSRTIGHGFWCTLIAVNNSNDDNNNKRYKQSVSKEKGDVEPCLVKCFNLISSGTVSRGKSIPSHSRTLQSVERSQKSFHARPR